MSHPVTVHVARAAHFDRAQALVRLLVMIVVPALVGHFGSGLLYFGLPALAAILIAQAGGAAYLRDWAPRMTRVFEWATAFFAWLWMLTDRFPYDHPEHEVRITVVPHGEPTVGTALLRLLFSLPAMIVAAVLSLVAALVWILALVSILATEHYPHAFFDFLQLVLRYELRVVAYHLSLVDRYPTFESDETLAEPA